MQKFLFACLFICIAFPAVAQKETTHTLQVGDTLQALAESYDTCREAIIYHNDLTLKGLFSRYYFLEAGTELTVPPRSACDELPMGMGYHTVEAGETTQELLAKYRYPQTQLWREGTDGEVQMLMPESTVQPGDELIIANMTVFYTTTQELYVTDESKSFTTAEHVLQSGDTLASLAEQYQTCREAIIWENKLTLPRAESVAYVMDESDTLVIPSAVACDALPFGRYTITLDERMTQKQLILRYRQVAPIYYNFNEMQLGLLDVGTIQIIPTVEYMFLPDYDLLVTSEQETETVHTLQVGDTFSQLAEQYGTCVEAILYVNDLERTGNADPTFKVEAGSELVIPPARACDTIPNDPIVYKVGEGDTLWGIASRYNTTVNMLIGATISLSDQVSTDIDALENPNLIEPGMEFVIPDGSLQYQLRHGDRLLVYGTDDMVVHASPNLSISEIAGCYGVDAWELSEANGLRDVRYTGGSLLIPNPQQDCILRDYGYGAGVVACYPELIEAVAGLDTTEPLEPTLIDEDRDLHCYDIPQVYEHLFQNQSVILYDYDWIRRRNSSEAWDLSMAMINYCFRHDGDLFKEITFDRYDTSILPPDDDIHVYARPEHITCNPDMFNDYYMYQVQRYDRLNNIARAYGTHPDLIAQVNGMENPNLIYVGQYLLIPTPTIFHVLHGLGVALVLLGGAWGLRRLMRRRTEKVKRKPKWINTN